MLGIELNCPQEQQMTLTTELIHQLLQSPF